MKLHTQTSHELGMCPIEFGVQKVKVTKHGLPKMVMSHNFYPFTPIAGIMKLYTQTLHELRMFLIDFGSKVQR